MIEVSRRKLYATDVGRVREWLPDHPDCCYILYRHVLAMLADQLDGAFIIDAGTYIGSSAMYLAVNEKNEVASYDVKKHPKCRACRAPNVTFYLKSILDIDEETLMRASMIFLDIDPHKGKEEQEFYNRLVDLHWEGFMPCDDITLTGGMRRFWREVMETKFEMNDARVEDGAGFGIIDFAENIDFRWRDV